VNITDINRSVKQHQRRKRVGRGESSGSGKTAGRGHKGFGQKNSKSLLRFEGGQQRVLRTAPKRGFNQARFRTAYLPVNLASLERLFESGETVDPAALRAKGLSKRVDRVKILGNGELTKALTVKAHAYSKSAREKIEAAGGTAQTVAPAEPAGKAGSDA
jgi:large subunit ribosomal protein L15